MYALTIYANSSMRVVVLFYFFCDNTKLQVESVQIEDGSEGVRVYSFLVFMLRGDGRRFTYTVLYKVQNLRLVLNLRNNTCVVCMEKDFLFGRASNGLSHIKSIVETVSVS